MNVVPCLVWVKQGAAAEKPDRVRLSRKDMASVMHMPPSDFARETRDSNTDSDTSVDKRLFNYLLYMYYIYLYRIVIYNLTNRVNT